MTLVFPAQPIPSTLSVGTGSVTVAWVGERVLYARLCGDFSVRLGAAQIERLAEVTKGCTDIHYFADGAALTRYDPVVRDMFAAFVRSRADVISSVTLLARDETVRRVARPLVQ
ncbi:MAG TPA: hypothetical protein VGK73_20460 [Polyangiaceae bacterium]